MPLTKLTPAERDAIAHAISTNHPGVADLTEGERSAITTEIGRLNTSEKTLVDMAMERGLGNLGMSWDIPQGPPGAEDNPLPENTEISNPHRWAVKNFGNEGSHKYLQAKYPQLEIEQRPSGIVYKDPAGQWRHMDPPGLDWADVGDIAWDIPAAMAEGLGATAGGVLGGLGGLGISGGNPIVGGAGFLGGAGLGGGGTAAGLEAGRQWIGKQMGVNEEVSGTDVAISGGLGGLASMLPFGTQLPKAKKILAPSVAEGGSVDTVVKPIRKAAVNTWDLLTGVFGGPEKEMKNQGRRKLADVKRLEELWGTDVIPKEVQALKADLDAAMDQIEQGMWGRIERALAEQGEGGIDLKPLRDHFYGEKARLQLLPNKTRAQQRLINHLDNIHDEHFMRYQQAGGHEVPVMRFGPDGKTPVQEALDIKRGLQEAAQYGRSLRNLPKEEREAIMTIRGIAEKATKVLDDAVPDLHNLNADYRMLQKHRGNLQAAGLLDKGVDPPDMSELTDLGRSMGEHFPTSTRKAGQILMNPEKSPGIRETLEGVDATLAKLGTPPERPFGERVKTLEAAKNWVLPEKAGMAGVGAPPKGKRGALMPLGLVGGVVGGIGGLATGNPLPLLGIAGGMASAASMQRLLSPRNTRHYINAGNKIQSTWDNMGDVPDFAKRAMLQQAASSAP